ncbi:OmpA family protein [Thermodesulfobacteriota bacterium]
MKAKHFIVSLFVLVFGVFLVGSANISSAAMVDSGCGMVEIACGNSGTNAKLKSGYHVKVDNFLILQDTSSSMGEPLAASGPMDRDTKIEYSKGLVNCLNDTLPDNMNVNAGMRNFGFLTADKGLVYGMTGYSKSGLAGAIKSVKGTAGVTPIAKALNYAGKDLNYISRPTAVILFSDGVNTVKSDPVAAAAALKKSYPNVCIYTVQIGDDPMGQKTLEQIADASKCGFATSGSAIADANGMDKFVTDVFLASGMKKITITLHIEFDFDKDAVRPQHHDDVKRIADALNNNPTAKVQLEGHTDSMGPDSYNMALSKRRAESVKKYLVEKFKIKASRISTVGYGESKPVASNNTAAGKQKNRRVVAHIQ